MKIFHHIKNRFAAWRGGLLWFSNIALGLLSVLGLSTLIYEIGFPVSPQVQVSIRFFYGTLIRVFLALVILRFGLSLTLPLKRTYFITEGFTIIIFILLLTGRLFVEDWIAYHIRLPVYLDHIVVTYTIVFIAFAIELSRNLMFLSSLKVSPALIFVASFFVIILAGSGLLLLPKATHHGITVTDAFFIATSAVCVTGLSCVNFSAEFTDLGKFFVMILIQIGGLGIMTFTSFFAYFFSGGYSFENRLMLKDFINIDTISEIFKTITKIFFITFFIELMGVALIYHLSADAFSSNTARLKFAIFHSVSAYCNAGFSTLENGLFDASLRANYALHLVIAFLVVTGGIGFPIVFNFYSLIKYRLTRMFSKLVGLKTMSHQQHIINVNTKIVLYTTGILLVVGFAAFYIAESQHALKDLPLHGKIATSIFGAVTPRTAGFNTIDMTSVTPALALIYLLLMWIGGSPSSTAGGIKTSTFAVAMLNIVNLAKARDRIEIFGREIPMDAVKRSYAAVVLSLLFIGLGVFLITVFEPQLSLTSVAFECFSAYSTVGLSLGITGELHTAGKYVIIALMFVGRVSVLTLVFIFVKQTKFHRYRLPSDSIFIN